MKKKIFLVVLVLVMFWVSVCGANRYGYEYGAGSNSSAPELVEVIKNIPIPILILLLKKAHGADLIESRVACEILCGGDECYVELCIGELCWKEPY